jgi:hypothetical protein
MPRSGETRDSLYTEWGGYEDRVMLYNHRKDPDEDTNIAGLSEFKALAETYHNSSKNSGPHGASAVTVTQVPSP